MGDDITIGVTEIVNNIEVTAQPNDQIVDISVIDNADDVTLNITPTVIEINVNRGSSFAKWGDILGTLSDQTDLQNALNLKANLVGGKVPASELPSYVDDVVEVANYAALPATGETGKIYVTLDNNKIYRWSGSVYIEIAANNAIWGAITGTLSSQTDLQAALDAKQDDLISGTNIKTIEGQSLLGSGNIDLTKSDVGLSNVDNTSDANKPISTATQTALDAKQNTITLTTTGTSGSSTLVGSTLNIPNYTTDISGLVPYTGATANVDLGTHKLTASDLVVNHASGSGVAASITKGGNGEALTVLKTSGSGNAASILGGVTLLDELHLNTDLADAYIASATTWNAKQAALNGTGFVKISGTTISYDNSTYVPTARTLTINGTTFDLSANRSWTISTGISGSGTTNYLPKFTGSTDLGNSILQEGTNAIGLANSPSSWGVLKSLEMPFGASFSGHSAVPITYMNSNSYYNGSNWIYKSTYLAGMYLQDATEGAHKWFTAPSGTAGNAITFSEAMRITSTGNVGIGTTSPIDKLNVNGGVTSTGLANPSNTAIGSFQFGYDGTNGIIRTWNSSPIIYQAYNYQSWETSGSERMRITSGGNVGIGTTSPAYKLDVAGTGGFVSSVSIDSSNTPFLYFRSTRASGQSGYIKDDGNMVFQKTESGGGFRFLNSSSTILMSIDSGGNVDIDTLGTGLVYSNSGVLTSTNPSDSRLKDNIVSLNYGLNEILKLRPVSYNWKNDKINQGKQFGFIAQEVQEVMPELVKEFETEEGNRLGLDKEGIYAALVNAIKELKAEIEILKTK